MPTIDDVSRRAGVSTATVSRCLNAPDRVRPETRARVEAAVAELGYTPHFGGRALAANRTNTIGVVIPTMASAIFALGIQSLQEELSANDVTLLVATSHYDPDLELKQIRTLLGRGVDGLALIGEARPDDAYKLLHDRQVPFVLLWSYREDCTHGCVGFDNHAAARRMAERVLEVGHRQIAMVAGIQASNDRAAARVDGVRDALSAKGLRLDPPFLAEAPYTVDESAEAARALLTLSPRPTVIVSGNDVQAAGALLAARSAGLHVPDDLSIVGFDDIELASVVDPQLTTVHVPHRRMGRAAARRLLAMIRSGDPGENIAFETTIVERGSLAAPSL
ncbi:MAG: LacI family DNA-binding transcriptional regulator [Geminicoccaceae bacterium]